MSQVWPNPDLLDQNGSFGVAFGTYLIGWLGARMDAGTNWGTAKLMQRKISSDFSQATCIASNAYEGKRHGFVRREELAELGGAAAYGRVDGTFYARPATNFPEPVMGGWALSGGCGVLARVIGGTLVEPAAGVYDPVVYLNTPSGYAAYLVRNGDKGRFDVVLERWNAGTRTELARTTLTPIVPSITVPFVVRLEMLNSVSDVTLTVSLKNIAAIEGNFGLSNSSGKVGTVPSWATLTLATTYTAALTYVDTSASRLASPGRAGVIVDKENRAAIATSSGVVNLDTDSHCLVFDMGTTAITRLRDEFVRVSPVGRAEVTRWGDTGWNAAPDMGYDRASSLFQVAQQTPYTSGATYLPANGYQGSPVSRLTTASFGIIVTHGQNRPAQNQLCMIPREMPEPARARFKATFRHQATGAGESGVHFGVALRAGQADERGFDTTYIDCFAGYVFRIAGDGRCSILRRRYAANVLDADAFNDTIELCAVTIAHSTSSRTLEVQCIDDSTPDPFGNPVLLSMLVDGTQVPFTSVAVAGVSVDGSGVVRDASAGRILPTRGVGLWFGWPTTGAGVSKSIEVTALQVITPSGATTPDSDLANVVFGSETAGTTGTLSFTPSWTIPLTPDRPSVHAGFVSGNRQSRPVTTAERELYELHADAIDDDAMLALEQFYDSHGGAIPFNYTVPRDTARKWRFVGPLEAEMVEIERWSVTFRIEEAIDA